jgi:hypothetical protein
MRSTTFLLTAMCTLVQDFGVTRVQTRALRNGSAARRRTAPRHDVVRRACVARASASGRARTPGPPRRPCPALPEAPRAPRAPRSHSPSRLAPAGRTASNGPPVASVPHGCASYRGRRPPLGTSPSAPRSQASVCVALKGGRCSFLDAQDPPPLRRAASASHAVDTAAVEFPVRPRSPRLGHAHMTASAYRSLPSRC